MTLFHVGKDLQVNTELIPDYKKTIKIILPLIKALEIGDEAFSAVMLQARYTREVLRKSRIREWSDSTKWGTEAIFEYVRANEFTNCYSRLESNFFYNTIEQCEILFKNEYIDTGDDDGTVFLYKIELERNGICEYDMELFSKAYNELENYRPSKYIKEIARNYWSGQRTEKPIIEILSKEKAIIREKINWSWI